MSSAMPTKAKSKKNTNISQTQAMPTDKRMAVSADDIRTRHAIFASGHDKEHKPRLVDQANTYATSEADEITTDAVLTAHSRTTCIAPGRLECSKTGNWAGICGSNGAIDWWRVDEGTHCACLDDACNIVDSKSLKLQCSNDGNWAGASVPSGPLEWNRVETGMKCECNEGVCSLVEARDVD